MGYMHKTIGPFAEQGGVAMLSRHELGLDPLEHDLVLQVTGLAGGSAEVFILGPADTWAKWSKVPILEDDLLAVDGIATTAVEVRFAGTGGAGKVWVQAAPKHW